MYEDAVVDQTHYMWRGRSEASLSGVSVLVERVAEVSLTDIVQALLLRHLGYLALLRCGSSVMKVVVDEYT